jgi:hypothetical protein
MIAVIETVTPVDAASTLRLVVDVEPTTPPPWTALGSQDDQSVDRPVILGPLCLIAILLLALSILCWNASRHDSRGESGQSGAAGESDLDYIAKRFGHL